MNQAAQAVNYMLNHGALTRQIAFMSLDIANLTAVMSDVRDLGIDPVRVDKTDPKGRRYASYTIPFRLRLKLRNEGRVQLDGKGELAFRG